MRWIALVGFVALGPPPHAHAHAGPAPAGSRAPRVAPDSKAVPPRSPLTRDALRPDVVGCFALAGAPAPGGRGQGAYLYASPRVRLDARAVGGPPRDGPPGVERRLWRLDAAGRPLPPLPDEDTFAPPRWTADSLTDTVRLWFNAGFSGAAFALAARPGADTLRGRAANHWDYGPPFVTDAARASAVRVPCQ